MENKNNYDKSYRDRYSAYQQNNRVMQNQMKNNLSGNMLSQQLANRLNFVNGVNSDINSYNAAEAQGKIADYQNQANNTSSYYDSLRNYVFGNVANLDNDSYRKLISKITY